MFVNEHESETDNFDDYRVIWGGLELDDAESTGHFLGVGSPGSGKSIMLRVLMQSVLQHIGTGRDMRALIYDAKQDVLPILDAYCESTNVKTLNPFDARGVAWDLYRDVREPRVAVEIAFTLIPREHESQPFFSDAARHLVYGVILSFLLSGHEWTFADLLRGLANPSRLKRILKAHPETRDIVSRYFYDRRLVSNIMSTLATKMLTFEPIAGAWELARERISLEDWTRNELILVLGNSETSRTAINAVNRCLFKRASDLTLQQSESFTRRTWFIIDEASEAGRLDGFVSLLKKGRSKGACVAISFQSVSGLRDQSMYGPHFTDEILGQIANRFFGRIECPETAEWASRLLGDQEISKCSVTHGGGSDPDGKPSGNTYSVTEQDVIVRAVLPSEFMSMTPCNRDNGLSGYFLVRSVGCYRASFSGEEVFDHWLFPTNDSVAEFVPRDPRAQLIRPWTSEEERKFAPEPPKAKLVGRKLMPQRRQDLTEKLKNMADL